MSLSAPVPFKANVRLLDFMRQADAPGIINLAAGVPGPDALPAEALTRAFQKALQRDNALLYAYHHPEGDHQLRGLLAQRLQKRGVAGIAATQIVTTTGCTQALQVMLSLLVKPGTVVACEGPAYYGMLEILSEAGAHVLPLPVHGTSSLDLEETEALLRQYKPACLVICPTLSNPSGATLPTEKRQPLVELCRTLGIRIIEDDIYGELLDSGALPTLLSFDPTGETVSYVTSFSKTVSPGLRTGFCVPGTLHEAFAARKCMQDLHSGVVTEAMLREFLAAGELDPHLDWLRQRNQKRRTIALNALRKTFPSSAVLHEPDGGYMLWVQLPKSVSLPDFQAAARLENVVFGGGHVFYPCPAPAPFMRLNCAKESEENLVLGINRLGSILQKMA